MVETGEERMITACEIKVSEGMNVTTENSNINRVRKLVAELLVTNFTVDLVSDAHELKFCAVRAVKI